MSKTPSKSDYVKMQSHIRDLFDQEQPDEKTPGKRYKEIAEIVDRSTTTVGREWKKYKEELKENPKKGCKRCLITGLPYLQAAFVILLVIIIAAAAAVREFLPDLWNQVFEMTSEKPIDVLSEE
eukprot:CAMPEP_0201510640 /NCGR_PEP_ID=MMETSP0161_2-20130828/3244_1 /ASSEMBLY_ACC=CAM_ASM_000251 /TAXON_ID=180227 /ORGANISM="Neoparamoeba aestuarina, Strain SoJaBio B1-5/56/2" /LENGTH=123 /DNA_ID=CAMNT_0047905839 /DNA_START=39 /DNA_END=410 /DNA_ORIENTATION=+